MATCASCTTRECIRGSDRVEGCGTGLFIPKKVGNLDCTFCLDCADACPKDNVVIAPGRPVDDLLFSESASSGYAISERTVALLSAKYGDLRPEREPTSYAGMVISRDGSAGTLRLSMPQKIIEAAREHYPELLSGEQSPSPPPKGLALRRLADALAMPTERAGKLSRKQVPYTSSAWRCGGPAGRRSARRP